MFLFLAFIELREMSNGESSDRLQGNTFGSCIDGTKCMKRTAQETGMWFGPRLGRRRRSGERMEVGPEIEALANALDGTRWTLVKIPGKRFFSRNVFFLPSTILKKKTVRISSS